MSELIKLISDNGIGGVVVTFILLCLAVRGIVDFIKWVKKMLEDYRAGKNTKEDEVKNIMSLISSLDRRVTMLEEQNALQNETLVSMGKKLDNIAEDHRRQTVAAFRSTIMRIHSDVFSRTPPRISQIEYETFCDIADIYIEKHGNHTAKDRLIPEIKDLYNKQGACEDLTLPSSRQ